MLEGFELRGFSPTAALEALADLGPDFAVLVQNGVRGKIRSGALGAEPLVLVPAAAANQPSGEIQPTYERLLAALEARATHVERQEAGAVDASWWPLDRLLPILLFESRRDDEPAQPETGEWLLIDRRGDGELAMRLCEDLRFHATHCRLAPVNAAGGETTPCYLLHVLADPERKPSLSGLSAGGGLDELDRLAAFRSAERTVFLPTERAPSIRALDAYCRLVALGLGPSAVTAERLAAVLPRTGDDGEVHIEVFPLAGIDFVDQLEITPPPSTYAELEVLGLERSETELQQLRERILRQGREDDVDAVPVGYRLELRPGYPAAHLDRELERLSGRLAELEQRRAYLESLQRPRPVLLRFTQLQLSALADAVRTFPPAELAAGQVLYGFQSTQDNPGGWHYLYYDPSEAVRSESYSPWRWSRLEELEQGQTTRNTTIHFWLDPLWAADYHGGGESLVFVPRGLMLFPSLHSWHHDQMDAYLRDLVRHWFPGEPAIAQVPQRALYLFDEVRRDDAEEAEIRIQVLDRGKLTPFTEHIGWINDNLTLQRAVGGAEVLLEKLADQAERRRLASLFAKRAHESERAFEAAADAAHQKLGHGSRELLDLMTAEIARIAERCRKASEEIPRMHELLEKTADTLEKLQATSQSANQAADESVEATEKNLEWIAAFDDELTKLDFERQQIELRVTRSVESLEARYQELLDRLR